MSTMPTISSYYGDANSGLSLANMVSLGGTDFYFSFDRIVAIRCDNVLTVIEHSPEITVHHLNAIDGGSQEAKAKRVSKDMFDEFLKNKLSVSIKILPEP